MVDGSRIQILVMRDQTLVSDHRGGAGGAHGGARGGAMHL
eukprot:SAG11_NODE_17722_length_510_cov_1.683698_1_plen_39_part_10